MNINQTMLATALRMIADAIDGPAGPETQPVVEKPAPKLEVVQTQPAAQVVQGPAAQYNAPATANPWAHPTAQPQTIPATRQDVIDAFTQLQQNGKAQAIYDILSRLGTDRVPNIPEAQLGNAVAMARAALAGEAV